MKEFDQQFRYPKKSAVRMEHVFDVGEDSERIDAAH